MKAIRLVLADDHPLILDGLERLFAGQEGFEIRARCLNGEDALAAVRREQPDVLLLDLHMPKMDGLSVVLALNRERHPTRVVILTGELSEREALECLRLGVAGVVLKDMDPSQVLQCVEKVAAGDVWVEKRSFSRVMEHLLRREAAVQQIGGKLSATGDSSGETLRPGHEQRGDCRRPLARRGDGEVSPAPGV